MGLILVVTAVTHIFATFLFPSLVAGCLCSTLAFKQSKAALQEKLKGAQCSVPMKSRVPASVGLFKKAKMSVSHRRSKVRCQEPLTQGAARASAL